MSGSQDCQGPRPVAAGKGNQLIEPADFTYCEQTAASATSVLGYFASAQLRNSAELLPKIQVPVIVFIGSEDKVMAGLAEKVEPLAGGEQLRIEVLGGADYFFRDLSSEDIVDLIAESGVH